MTQFFVGGNDSCVTCGHALWARPHNCVENLQSDLAAAEARAEAAEAKAEQTKQRIIELWEAFDDLPHAADCDKNKTGYCDCPRVGVAMQLYSLFSDVKGDEQEPQS